MNFEHTPGPWKLQNDTEIWADVHIGEDQDGKNYQPIYEVPIPARLVVMKDGTVEAHISYESWRQFPSNDFKAMQEANARLIVTSPKLLRALRVLLRNAELGEYESQKLGLPRMTEAHDLAKEAIKEATIKT